MDIMAALADPVRREILEILYVSPLGAGKIAERFPISRPAISRHLRILREAGLVVASIDGREWVYRFESGPLATVDEWIAQFREPWTSRLDALETEIFRTRRERERVEAAKNAIADEQVSTSPPVGFEDEQKEQIA